MSRWRVVAGLVAAALAAGGVAAARSSLASGARAKPRAAESVRIFYTAPVLVRSTDRVAIPVDAVCSTDGGVACSAAVTLGVRSGSERWRSATAQARAGLAFDVSAAASRAVAASGGEAPSSFSGAVDFYIQARTGLGRSAALPALSAAAPLRFYVVERLPRVDVPSIGGRAREGKVVLSLPWGSGPGSVGLVPGNESLTEGPSAFDVDAMGRVFLLDSVQNRLGVFDGGRLLRRTRLAPAAHWDVAAAADGAAYVLSRGAGGLVVSTVSSSGRLAGTQGFGRLIPGQIRTSDRSAYVHLLPLDAWVRVGDASATSPAVGRPVGAGRRLLSVVRGRSIRLGEVVGESVQVAVELRFAGELGELALAEPDGGGGHLLVAHVAGSGGTDRYQVVHIRADRSLTTFAVASEEFAETATYSKFRLGRDGYLYQLTSSPAGMRIVRFEWRGQS
jgi:hypothetical protein